MSRSGKILPPEKLPRNASAARRARFFLTRSVRQLLRRIAARFRNLDHKDCAGFLEDSTKKLSAQARAALAKVDVISVRIKGDHGYILYAAGGRHAMPIEIEGGRWRVAGVLGTPLL